MPPRSLLTTIILALAMTIASALGLRQVSADGARVFGAQPASQPLVALQDAMLPGQVEVLRVDELTGILREVERSASRCLEGLSWTTRALIAPQGKGALLREYCNEGAGAAQGLIVQLRALPTAQVALGDLQARERAQIGAQVALIGAFERRVEATLGGAYQVALTSLLATLLALSAMAATVASLALLRFARAVTVVSSMALDQVRRVPALAVIDRRELRTELERALERVGSPAGEPSAALFCFSLERPEWAHGEGADERWREVLFNAQQRLGERVRGDDFACALVSDELVLLARRIADPEQASGLAQRLVQRLDVPCDVDGERYQPALHGGFALYPDHADDADALVRNAEKAMREARRQGHREPVCFCPQSQAQLDERGAIEAGLRQALARGELSLVYQPVVNLTEGVSRSVEALLRWRHPELGDVPPGKFIPVAEQSDLILPIGEWVLNESMQQVRAWRDRGLGEVRASVNVSVRQLMRQDVAGLVASTLQRLDLGGDCLLLEVTESMLMQEQQRAWEVLARVREMGVRVALDDFGTGYSSLSYLSGMPLDYLKIDRSFLRINSDEQRAIIRTIIGLARALGVQVVAEGVEDQDAAAFVLDAGVQFAQGYLFSRPVPAAQIDWGADYSPQLPQEADIARLLSAW